MRIPKHYKTVVAAGVWIFSFVVCCETLTELIVFRSG